MSRYLAISAPGKVLLAGGYLVLDRQYTGLVFALNARIHVLIRAGDAAAPSDIIVVRSPQFTGAEWRYRYRRAEEEGGGVEVMPLEDFTNKTASRNVFLENALSHTLSYVSWEKVAVVPPAVITILADNEYYSHTTSSVSSLDKTAAQGRFADFQVPLSKAHKTGLGSSAALVTALVAALLGYYLSNTRFVLLDGYARQKAHHLAQMAHCAAQGKIGSGFDVTAAAGGSCLYRRFSPSMLDGLGKPGSQGFAERLRTRLSQWDALIGPRAARLPDRIRLVLCDVDGGTETVGMVQKVLAWRRDHPAEAHDIWQALQERTTELKGLLNSLTEMRAEHRDEYERDLDVILGRSEAAVSPEHLWQGCYQRLRDHFVEARRLIRQMSAQAAVPIEPASQTALLDACSALRGVLGGIVPGAGGYDAIALLVIDDREVLDGLDAFLQSWERRSGGPADHAPIKVRMMNVREDMEGLRMEEDHDYYRAWIS